MTGALAAALSEGAPTEDAMRRAVAAAAVNVRRRGLGTGSRDTIDRLIPGVVLEPLEAQRACGAGARALGPEPRSARRPSGRRDPSAQPRGARAMLTSVQTLDPQA